VILVKIAHDVYTLQVSHKEILTDRVIHCMYRSSVYYDELKAQLLETDKDKLEGTLLSHPMSGK